MRDCLSISYGRAEQNLSNHGVNMDIVIAVGLSLSVMLATAVWVSDKLKTYKEDLKRLTDEWFMEYAQFRDSVTERLDERETDIVNILAELERIKKLEDIDDDKFHSLDMQIAELTRSQQLLLRTILERFPLPEKPTTPVRRKR